MACGYADANVIARFNIIAKVGKRIRMFAVYQTAFTNHADSFSDIANLIFITDATTTNICNMSMLWVSVMLIFHMLSGVDKMLHIEYQRIFCRSSLFRLTCAQS